jgi:hypothetical protein
MIDREILCSPAPRAFPTQRLNNFLPSFGLYFPFVCPRFFPTKKVVMIWAFNSPHRVLVPKLRKTLFAFTFFGFRHRSIGSKPGAVTGLFPSPVGINPLSSNRFASSPNRNSARLKRSSHRACVVSIDGLHDESVGSFLDHVPLIELLFSTRYWSRPCHLAGTI